MRFSLLAVAALAIAARGYATDRFYPDISVESPGGHCQLEAKSPDNRLQGYHPWQDEFVYTMSKDGDLAWKRSQADQTPEECSPVRIVVSDDGWSAIQTGWDQLVFVDADGRNRARISDIKTLLSDNDRREFTRWSTAGVIWSPSSLWHFVDLKGDRLFVIRLWWGYHLFLDPVNGRRIDHKGAIDDSIRDFEVDHCLAILRRTAERGFNDACADDVSTAALLAGQLQIEGASTFLKELEKSEYVGLYGGSIKFDLESGAVNPFFFQQYAIRQIAQLSLRRLGVAPAPLPVYVFPKKGVDDVFRPKTLANRADNARSIGSGMAALDVLESLGSPDFISYPDWSYDFDGQNPMSMTIEFDAGFVRRVEIGEPLWTKGLARDEAVVGF